MADVQVTFGASIERLVDGVEGARSAIEGFKSEVEHIAEAFGIAFSIEKVSEFIDSMGELGEQTERMSAILGVSTEQIGRLDAIAKGSGSSTEGLARAFEVFQANLQKAQSGTGPAAEALKALGLSAKDFINLPFEQQLGKFADAQARFADGGNKLAIVRALWGRMGDDLIPLFDKGSKGFEELAGMAERAGTTLSGKTAAAFEETHLKLTELGMSVEGLGIRAFRALEPVIDKAATALTKFIESIDQTTITNAMKAVGAVIVNLLEDISTFFIEAIRWIDEMVAKLNDLGSFDWKRTGLNFLDPNLGDMFLGKAKTIDGALGEIEDTAKSRTDAIRKLADQYRDAIAKFSPAQGAEGAAAVKPPAPSFDASGGASKAAAEQFQTQIKLADEEYKQTQEHLASEVKLHELTYEQETQALLAALAKRHDAENAQIDGELVLYARGSAGYQKVIAEREQLDAKYAAEHQKIIDQAAEHEAAEWKSVADQMSGAFNSQLKSLLDGTESWGQAMKKIFADLALKFIETQITETVETAATVARNVALHLSGEAAKTSATVAGASTRTAAEEGSSAAIAGAKIAEVIVSIEADVAKIFTGITAFLSSFLGPAAPAVALGIAGGVGALAISKIGKFEEGAYNIPGTMLAMLHPNEMVLDAGNATSARKMFEGGGGGSGGFQVNINGPVIGTQAWINQLLPQLSRAVYAHQAANPSSYP